MIEIQMATEGLDEKKNREKTNRKTNVDFPWGSCSHFGCIPDMDY